MVGTPGGSVERPALFFEGPHEFRAWLQQHHDSATELWMGRYKKHVPKPGLLWEDAVREALCFGWIDSQVQRIDENAVRQRWTPRRPGSVWSAVNVAAAEELIATGRMQPAGLAAYQRRRADRQGIYSYEQDDEPPLPEEFEAVLRADPVAAAFWDAATVSYRRICVTWIVSAAREPTRDKRLAQLVEDCRAGRLIPSQRYGTEPGWVRRVRDEMGLSD